MNAAAEQQPTSAVAVRDQPDPPASPTGAHEGEEEEDFGGADDALVDSDATTMVMGLQCNKHARNQFARRPCRRRSRKLRSADLQRGGKTK